MEQREEYWARSQKTLLSHLVTGSAVQRKSIWSENQNRRDRGEVSPIFFVPDPLLILGKQHHATGCVCKPGSEIPCGNQVPEGTGDLSIALAAQPT